MSEKCIFLREDKKCECLEKVDPRCGTKGCHFFKTPQEEYKSQAKARARCERLGGDFHTQYPVSRYL